MYRYKNIQYAKKIYKTQEWKEYLKYEPIYYEEKVIQGMLIGFNTKEDIKEVQKYIENSLGMYYNQI